KSPRDHEAEGIVGRQLAEVLSDPETYNKLYNQDIRGVEFDALDDDEFFAMGDNSSRSYDGRLWRESGQSHHPHAVNRRALIGKAFFIYWPHGIPFLNNGKGFPVVKHAAPQPPAVDNYPLYTAPFYPQWWRWSRIR
ncbi:MAG: S26 family signal peptidase, partial [Planctomycetales bacterium]